MSASRRGDPEQDEGNRHAVLAQADALRDDPAHRADVLDVYLVHRTHLEPGTAEGARRVWFVLEHVPRTTLGLEDLFAEAGATAPDRDTADRALIAAATFAARRNDYETAYARLREGLLRRRGSDTAIERSGCINLAAALRMESRYAEALLVARRAATMTVTDDEPRGRVAALGVLAETLLDLAEPERAQRVIDELAGLVPGDPDDAGSVAVQIMIGWLRVHAAESSGRLDEAVWRMDVLRARENPTEPHRRSAYAGDKARLLLDAGRTSEAALALREARGYLSPKLQEDIRLSILEARAAEGLDDLDSARERAEHALATVERLVDATGPHRSRVSELVSLFARLGDVERERRCLELAATARLEQISRADRAAREIPELAGATSAEDRAILRRARERALVESRDTLTAFAHLLAPAIRDGDARALVLTPADDDLIRVCAWCARIAGRDGRWLPLGHLVPAEGPIRATHGMCPDCLTDSPSEVVAAPTP